MSDAPFVPADFDPPRELEAPDLHLVPLHPRHNASDHAAWSSSIAHIQATPGFQGWGWQPAEGMSLAANPADVARLDGPLHEAVAGWLARSWPFERVVHLGRT